MLGFALSYLVLALSQLQQRQGHVSPVMRSRQLIVATIGFVAMIAIPAFAIYYARKRWRP